MNFSESAGELLVYGVLALLFVLAIITAKRDRTGADPTDHLADILEDEAAHRSGRRISGDW